ncbi:unnamed protein product, partial [Linum tenue]
VGNIPDPVVGTSKLRDLILEYNNLTGVVPPSLGNISSLEVIAVNFNNLGGTIPETLGDLKNLYFLSMGGNSFTGTIPISIYNISSMSILYFPQNQLQGTIPSEFGNLLPNLIAFSVCENRFTGEIPPSLSNASNLEKFTIARNRVSGTLPSMEKLHKLRWLSIADNLLGTGEAGDVDFLSTFSNLSSLQLVSMSKNIFGGSLSQSVVNFTELSILAVNGNKLSGRIPEGIGKLKKLEWLHLGNNRLTGSVPEELGELGNLKSSFTKGYSSRSEYSLMAKSSISSRNRLSPLTNDGCLYMGGAVFAFLLVWCLWSYASPADSGGGNSFMPRVFSDIGCTRPALSDSTRPTPPSTTTRSYGNSIEKKVIGKGGRLRGMEAVFD